ncbi:MAG: 2-phosphosulfolactate phosphatase [Deltaproteobacteria bacterium]|nr:2-phosphosulfolactate phosphatase [Deltaproteobacteria bacterium]
MGNCRISTGEKGAKSTKHDESCVIIDVLRASSIIVTALSHGVKEIRTLTSITDALKLKKQRYTTVGERKGAKLPGFDLGNSPVEFLNATKNNPIKKMAITTSNLTRVMAHLETAYICSSLNLTAVSKLLQGKKINIVAAGGMHGEVEDLGIALALMMKLKGIPLQKDLIKKMITQSLAARYLTSIGYVDDVKFVTQIDKYTVVPIYKKGFVACFKK